MPRAFPIEFRRDVVAVARKGQSVGSYPVAVTVDVEDDAAVEEPIEHGRSLRPRPPVRAPHRHERPGHAAPTTRTRGRGGGTMIAYRTDVFYIHPTGVDLTDRAQDTEQPPETSQNSRPTRKTEQAYSARRLA